MSSVNITQLPAQHFQPQIRRSSSQRDSGRLGCKAVNVLVSSAESVVSGVPNVSGCHEIAKTIIVQAPSIRNSEKVDRPIKKRRTYGRRSEVTKKHDKWTDKDKERLQELCQKVFAAHPKSSKISSEEWQNIANNLKRSVKTCQSYASTLGFIKKYDKWTDKDKERLRELYQTKIAELPSRKRCNSAEWNLIAQEIGHSVIKCQSYAARLGLTRKNKGELEKDEDASVSHQEGLVDLKEASAVPVELLPLCITNSAPPLEDLKPFDPLAARDPFEIDLFTEECLENSFRDDLATRLV